MALRPASLVVLVAALVACGDSSGDETAGSTAASGGGTGGGDAGTICGPWEAPTAAGCVAAGVPEGACAPGFEHDDEGGCNPILPAEPCALGTIAVPGDAMCRPVTPCGDAPWGDAPLEAGTSFVDGAYAGADSDGSAERPWTTIQQAIDAAPSNGMVVVAAGTYAEDLTIGPGSVRLFGRCPDEVVVKGTGVQFATVLVQGGASGTEIHGIAVGGPNVGVAISASKDVLVEGVWIHDTGLRGFDVENAIGTVSATLRGSLVERCGEVGMAALGGELSIEASAVRDTQGGDGNGIVVQDQKGVRSVVHVTGSLFERNSDAALWVTSSDLTVEGTVVQDTLPRASNGEAGWGVLAADFAGSDRATLALRSSALLRNKEVGVLVLGSDATIEDTVIRDTQPSAADEPDGLGIVYQDDLDTGERSSGSVSRSVVDRSLQVGVNVTGSDVTLEGIIVRGTLWSANDIGISRGINVSMNPSTMQRANVTIRGSVVADTVDGGIVVVDADATLLDLVVRGSYASPDNLYGDGIAVASFQSPQATASLGNVRVEKNARAGLGNFGSVVTIAGSTFECNAFELDGEPSEGLDFGFTDQGGNACGCEGQATSCKVGSANLAPPKPFAQ